MPKKAKPSSAQLAEFARKLGASMQATYASPTAVQPQGAPMTPYQANLSQQAAQLQAQQSAMFNSPPAVNAQSPYVSAPDSQARAAQAVGLRDSMMATLNSPTAIRPEDEDPFGNPYLR